MKEREKEFVFDYIDETLDWLEEDIEELNRSLSEKGPRFIVREERKERADRIVDFFEALNSSKDGIVEVLSLVKQIREVDARAGRLSLEIQRELAGLEMRKEKLRHASERVRELIEVYRSQVEKVMELLEKIPVEDERDFEKKLELVDRANRLLGELSGVIIKFLAL